MIEQTEEKIEAITTNDSKNRRYTCTVDPHLFNKLEKHVNALNALNGKTTKQSWIVLAIDEKLKNDRFSNEIPTEKHIQFPIDDKLSEDVEKRVEFIKKFRRSYSKKQFFESAIYEKLDRDTKKLQEQVEKIKSDAFDN